MEVVERGQILPKNQNSGYRELDNAVRNKFVSEEPCRVKFVTLREGMPNISSAASWQLCVSEPLDVESKELPKISNQQKNNSAFFALVVSIQGKNYQCVLRV